MRPSELLRRRLMELREERARKHGSVAMYGYDGSFCVCEVRENFVDHEDECQICALIELELRGIAIGLVRDDTVTDYQLELTSDDEWWHIIGRLPASFESSHSLATKAHEHHAVEFRKIFDGEFY